MKRISILAVEGCMASCVTGLLDVFTIANAYRAFSCPGEAFPFFIAETGLLDGKKATTNIGLSAQFARKYPDIDLNPQRIIVDNGDIICAGSTLSYRELSIYLIERYAGHETAVQCSKMLLIEKNRDSQAPFGTFNQSKEHTDDNVRAIQEWIESHFAEEVSAAQMAAKAKMSKRNFIRRFKAATGETFSTYLQQLRIEVAKKSLETTRLNIDEITYQIGYEDSRSFSRLFKKYTSLTPSAYRDRFSAMSD